MTAPERTWGPARSQGLRPAPGRTPGVRRAARWCGPLRRDPPTGIYAAVTTLPVPCGRCGAMIWPSGRSSPVSSKSRTPLHSRLHPCSGWCATRRADSRSAELADGHDGWCWHMDGIFRSGVMCEMAVVSVSRREDSFMAAPRCLGRSEPSVAPRASIRRDFAAPLSYRLMTHPERRRFIPTRRSLRMVRRGRIGLVRVIRRPCEAHSSAFSLVRANCGSRVFPVVRYERSPAPVQPRTPRPGRGRRGTEMLAGRAVRRVSRAVAAAAAVESGPGSGSPGG